MLSGPFLVSYVVEGLVIVGLYCTFIAVLAILTDILARYKASFYGNRGYLLCMIHSKIHVKKINDTMSTILNNLRKHRT